MSLITVSREVATHARSHTLAHESQTPATEVRQASQVERSGILLVGAPGSGKGTIGTVLNRIDGFIHVSSGDVIRRSITEKLLGEQERTLLAQGGLLCDEQLWRMFDAHLESLVASDKSCGHMKRLVLDGVPRTRTQVNELAKRVDVRGVFYFECDNLDVLRQRLSHRARVEGRVDDEFQDVIEKRLRLFEEETLPLLDAYPANMVHRIDATLRPAHVLAAVLAEINQLG